MTAIAKSRSSFAKSRQLLESNEEVIPGSLASINRRAEPCIAFKNAAGSRLWDLDNIELIDCHAIFSAYILGHGDADQNAAVAEAIQSGRSNFGISPTTNEGVRRALIDQGVYPFPVPSKQGSIGLAHTVDDIAATLDATHSALRSMAK